jgi:hypothetical protein
MEVKPMRATVRRGIFTAIVAGSLTAATSLGSPAEAVDNTVYTVGTFSATPSPATVPSSALPSSSGVVVAAVATPGGFKLQAPGIRRTDFVYDSDNIYADSYNCRGISCTLAAEVKVQLHQVAIGGSSHTWQLTLNMKQQSNPGALTWVYSSTYWCGINISGATDQICSASGAAPSNANMSVNTLVNKPWGSTNNITVFPMVKATTVFSNGVTVSIPFRGWDTLSRATTTKLNTSSGTG